jgi:hypothetical protein
VKIIAENKKEKEDLVKLSKYLHDFRIYYNGKTVKICGNDSSFRAKKNDLIFLDLTSDVGNYLRHIYTNPDVIEVEKQ